MGALSIRQASSEDVTALVTLINRAYEVEKPFIDGDRIDAPSVRTHLRQGTFLIAEAEGVPVGCVYVEAGDGRGYFGLLAVDPDRQGQGHARAIIDAVEARCRQAGCREIALRVLSPRTELPPFYRRLGYVEAGTEPYFNPRARQRCHFILMSKVL